MSKITLHLLCYNEHEILPYTLRHYGQFCSRMVVHDLGSSDESQDIARAAGAEVKQHDCKGEFNDLLNKSIKENEWKGDDSDWVIMADADELIHFPLGAEQTLSAYRTSNRHVIKPHGYEMLEDAYPTGPGQIIEYVKHGSREEAWYSKPILFSPKFVSSLEFSTGAHTVKAALRGGGKVQIDAKSPTSIPPTYLLHMHHLGGIERIGRLYNENRARQSAVNRANRWGLQEDGNLHAQRKRDLILPKLERVIA